MKTFRRLLIVSLIVLLIQHVSADIPRITQQISENKAIADTLPAAFIESVNSGGSDAATTGDPTALGQMQEMAANILRSINSNLLHQIRISPAAQTMSTDMNEKNSRFQAASNAVLRAATQITKSPNGQTIDDVDKALKELSSAVAAFRSTLTTKIDDDANTQLNSGYVAHAKLLAESIQNLNEIENADITDTLINLVEEKVRRIQVGMDLSIGSTYDIGIRAVHSNASKAFKSLSKVFSQVLDLLPDSFKNASGNVIRAVDVLNSKASSMFQKVETYLAAQQVPSVNDVSPFAVDTFVGFRNVAKTIAALNEVAAGQLTPEILIVLINLQVILSKAYYFESDIYYAVATRTTAEYISLKFIEPISTLNGAILEFVGNTSVTRLTDLNGVYDALETMVNNNIKLQDSLIGQLK